ncbi:unnamed protein product, partial [Allacma fusca]
MRFYILCTTCFLTYQETIHSERIPQIVGGEDAIPGKFSLSIINKRHDGRGASKYDSGSPLVCYDDKGPYVAGLDSFGYT